MKLEATHGVNNIRNYFTAPSTEVLFIASSVSPSFHEKTDKADCIGEATYMKWTDLW